MSTYISTRNIHIYIAAIALIAACDLEGETTAEADMTTKALGLGEVASYEPPLPQRLNDEARDLYNELAGRLAARGVTPDEARAAAATGDDEVVRELFGYTPEEFDRQYARLVALGQAVERDLGRSGGGPREPVPGEGSPPREQFFKCHPGLVLCSLAAAERASRYPGKVGLAIFAVGGLGCIWVSCSFDGTGRWTSRP